MDGKSLNITQELLDQIQNILPEVFSEGKIDWERLQSALGKENLAQTKDHYELSWAGKAEARKEIQKQTTATLIPERDKSINFDTTQNLFIEGENLEVLRALQRSYFGKVKMIYIDPPYNTGNDSFVYPDDYAERLKDYKERAGMVDENGYLNKQDLWKTNRKENGHFHSVWLSMMYPRLLLARNLLREDGVIFVSIDDNEQANLKLLMDEVFGRENFRNTFTVRRYDKNINRQFLDNGLKTFNVGFEYILAYSKSDNSIFYPIYKESSEERQSSGYWKGFWNDADRPTMRYELLGYTPLSGQWKWKKEVAFEAVNNYNLYNEKFSEKQSLEEYWENTGRNLKFIRRNVNGKGKNKGVEHWIPPANGILRNSNWSDLFASKGTDDTKDIFDFPKSVEVIKQLINSSCDDSDLILDFFAGSGTTGQAVLELNAEDGGNRRFILVQYPEPTDDNSEAKKAGYDTIADITRARLTKVIDRLKTKQAQELAVTESGAQDLGFKAFRLSESNFKQWQGDLSGKEAIQKQLELHKAELIKTEATTETILHELILKNGLPLTVTPEERVSGDGRFYHVADYGLCFCLEGFEWDALSKVKALKPRKVLVLNEVIERSGDVFLSNAHLELADAGIELELVK